MNGLDEQGALVASESAMLAALSRATGADFSEYQTSFRTFMAGAELAVQDSSLYGELLDIFEGLSNEYVLGNIRAVDAWASGESEFRVRQKSWKSVIDKLYRINIEDNSQFAYPPLIFTVGERAERVSSPTKQRWITPDLAHEVADDLIRTKFVVPFADGVVKVSEKVTAAIARAGLPQFRRYHAKDSGYHARHHYVLLPVPGYRGGDTKIALEIKVLTKMQDTLGELTHLLYEEKRTGRIENHSKRKVAWLFESPDFLASYIGHSGHFIEASIVELKQRLEELEEHANGQS